MSHDLVHEMTAERLKHLGPALQQELERKYGEGSGEGESCGSSICPHRSDTTRFELGGREELGFCWII